MYGSWYLPKFLLSEGLLTCIYIASFMFLVTPCEFLVDYGETVRAYWVSGGVTVLVYRGWGPEVFLELVPEGST